MADVAAHYAFPHTGADERRRLELFEERLDPVTVRRIKLLSLAPGVRCLEIGGGRGSVARWLCEYVGPKGRVTATDLETGFLSELSLPNLDVLRHDVTRDEFPESSFELIHVRAVLMHIADRSVLAADRGQFALQLLYPGPVQRDMGELDVFVAANEIG